MRIIVTGGGTGGHVFPALEVAKELRKQGADVVYFGSLRGQEGLACRRADIAFAGFPSEPLYKLTSYRGLRGAFNLTRATVQVRSAMKAMKPSAIFSTGGYASAPVTRSGHMLGVPFVLHEQNVVPGRTNKMLSRHAACVCTVFRNGHEHFPGAKTLRTGMPIRSEFRASQNSLGFAQSLPADRTMVLVMGGSQGAQAINEAALNTATRMTNPSLQWLHVAGPNHFDGMLQTKAKLGVHEGYELRAYLDAEEMASAMFAASVAVCRSGAGTLAELAALKKPSILIPYPHAFGDHQRANAREFVEMGAATVIEERDLLPSRLESTIQDWLSDENARSSAERALAEWDMPEAVSTIARQVMESAGQRITQ